MAVMYIDLSASEKPAPYKIFICLKIVDFPDSPAPRRRRRNLFCILRVEGGTGEGGGEEGMRRVGIRS